MSKEPSALRKRELSDVKTIEQEFVDAHAAAVEDPSNTQPLYRRRLARIPKKTLALSLFLFFGGCVLLPLGIWNYLAGADVERAYAMLVIGSIMFLPGFYSFFILFQYIRGIHGYHYTDLPEE